MMFGFWDYGKVLEAQMCSNLSLGSLGGFGGILHALGCLWGALGGSGLENDVKTAPKKAPTNYFVQT